MFKYVYFIGTGCGRPLFRRQLPGYLIELADGHSILLECGCIINTDDEYFHINVAKIETIVITSCDVELFAGLPSLLHSMRLMNRSKLLRIIAPNQIVQLLKSIVDLDTYESRFEITFLPIAKHQTTKLLSDTTLTTMQSQTENGRYQVFITKQSTEEDTTVFYTGKSSSISDRNLLIGHKYVIHDCTYSYDDWELAKKTGFASYREVLLFNDEFKPDVIFLVHFSTRYRNPSEIIPKHRNAPHNILYAYDGFRYDFVNHNNYNLKKVDV